MRSFGSGANSSETEKSDRNGTSVESEKTDEILSSSTTSVSPKTRRSLINRTNIYKTIERKLNALVF